MNRLPPAKTAKPASGVERRSRAGRRFLWPGILIILLLGGSAFSQALDIRIKNLIIIPSARSLPLVAEEGPRAVSGAAGVEIRSLRILAAKAHLSPLAPSHRLTQPTPALPALVQKQELFDPARFDRWDSKHRSRPQVETVDETLVLVAGLAFQYDTNLYRNPAEENPAATGVTNVDDGSIIGWAGIEYRLGLDQGLDSAIHLDLRTLRYFDQSEAGTTALSVGAYLHDRWSWGGLHLPYTYTYWWKGSGFEARASVHSLRPMLYWQALENYRVEATAVYENRNYFDQTHDAHHLGLELAHHYDFARPGTYLRLDKRLSNVFAGDEGYLLAGASLSGGVAVWRGLRIDGGLGYAHYWFENRPAVQIGQAGEGAFSRQDNQFQINAKICYQFSPAWEVGFDYVLTLNDSNVEGDNGYDPYNFHKHVLTLLASGRF